MNRVFKIVAKEINRKGNSVVVKKRIYKSLEDFNKYCIVDEVTGGSGTLKRYQRNYQEVYCYEFINNKWVPILVIQNIKYD